ncbi:MAG: phosphoenolpyruvate--protein phosphotransferase [Deltaproteobacteria bacterium]|nr:phosphoenolpyruvate--protein phosphotransferase [Candidatus Zymogenaceae bacterium]
MSPKEETRLTGIGVSSGIVIGKVYLIDRAKVTYSLNSVGKSGITPEIKRFRRAIEHSKKQLTEVSDKIRGDHFDEFKHIIDAHFLILQDRMIVDDTEKIIRDDQVNAEWALKIQHEKISQFFKELDDEYLSERMADVDYVVERIMRNLVGKRQESITGITEDVIVVAHDLSPADTAQIDRKVIKGFVTDIGGRTSHTAIMARSLEIPSVVGLETVSAMVKNGDCIIVNGTTGQVIINPSSEVRIEYEELLKRYQDEERELLSITELAAVTTDGYRMSLMANIEMPHEIKSIKEHGAEGIGLYRTEFIYLNRKSLPTEDEHFEVYKYVVENMKPKVTIIRTFDLGGDRFLSPIDLAQEMNPAMGLRAIRFCLKEVDIFKDQLRAILRASAYGPVKIMFPMISGIEEIRLTKMILEEAKDDLIGRGVPFDENIEIGTMMEVPSAMIIADLLAKEVDFFSIGTNDLIQYSLAIDRVNEHVNYLYEPLHPAVLRMIGGVVHAAHERGIKVGMCGEMAGEPLYLPILVGIGLDELSMNAMSILRVKKILREISYKDCRTITDEILTFATAREIDRYVFLELRDRFPTIFSNNNITH